MEKVERVVGSETGGTRNQGMKILMCQFRIRKRCSSDGKDRWTDKKFGAQTSGLTG